MLESTKDRCHFTKLGQTPGTIVTLQKDGITQQNASCCTKMKKGGCKETIKCFREKLFQVSNHLSNQK